MNTHHLVKVLINQLSKQRDSLLIDRDEAPTILSAGQASFKADKINKLLDVLTTFNKEEENASKV